MRATARVKAVLNDTISYRLLWEFQSVILLLCTAQLSWALDVHICNFQRWEALQNSEKTSLIFALSGVGLSNAVQIQRSVTIGLGNPPARR